MTGRPDRATADAALGRVARGGALGLAGAVAAAGAGFILVAVVTRVLGAATAGVFFALTSLFTLVVAIGTLGTDTGLGRFLLRHRASGGALAVRSLVRVAGIPAMAASVLLGAVLVVGAETWARVLGLGEEAAPALVVLGALVPAAVLGEVALAAARAHGRIRSTVVVDRLVRAWWQPLVVGALLAAGVGTTGLLLGWASAYVVSAVLAVLALRGLLRAGPPGETPPADGEVAAEFWSFTWLRGLARIAQVAVQKIDVVLVAALASPAAAAVYTAATRFVPLGQLSTQSLQQVLQPRFTALLMEGDTPALARVYRVATAWSILLAWPLYLGVAGLSGTYLALFGHEVTGADARVVVWVMAGAMMLAVASGPVDTLLLMSGRSAASAGNALVSLTVNLTGLVLLVPAWGIRGAAVAWAAAVLVRCGLAVVQVRRAVGVDPFSLQVGAAALAPVLCIGAPLLLVGALDPPLLLALGAAVVVVAAYGAVLAVARRRFELDLAVAALRGRAAAADTTPLTSTGGVR